MEESGGFPAELLSADEVALETIMEQFGDSNTAFVNFYRVEKGQPDALIEEKMSPSEFDFGSLGRRYGHGTYRIKLYVKDAHSGRYALAKNPTMRYAGPVDQQPQPGLNIPVTQRSDGLGELAQAMIAGFQELGKLIVQSNQAQPHISPEEIRRGMFQDLALMKEIMGNGGGERSSMSELLGIFTQGLELGKSVNPDAPQDGVSAVLKAIEPMTPAFGKIMEKLLDRPTPVMSPPAMLPGAVRPNPAAPVAAAPAPATGAQPEAIPQPEQETSPMNIYPFFKSQITGLVNVVKANPNADPYSYADVILDNIPAPYLDTILGDDKLVDNLAAVVPEVNLPEVRPFIEKVAAALHELTSPEQGENNAGHVSPGESAPTH